MANLKILCIGNSYSVGATKYLTQIAAQYGDEFDVCNLFIGGCSLERHYNNMMNNTADYRIYRNGIWEEVSLARISDYISAEKWDYITLQQASYLSFREETYEPYLSYLAAYARKNSPQSKLLIHQTQVCSEYRSRNSFKLSSRAEMYEKLIKCYDMAAKNIDAYGILPTGFASNLALEKYGMPEYMLYSDPGSHLGSRYGCYMAGLAWYGTLTGKDVSVDKYEIPNADERYMKIARLAAKEAAEKYKLK